MNFPFLLQGTRRGRLAPAISGHQPVPGPVGLARVKPATQPGSVHESLRTSRATFWRVYGEWMSAASQFEIDQLEAALVAHAPHVRSIHAAIGDAMRDRDSSMAMPLSLLAALDMAKWNPDSWIEAANAQRAA